jgi:DNA-binding CsgD family transcriptional regulator
MEDLTSIVKTCLLKNYRKIKTICTPLEESLQIPMFGYHKIDRKGHYCNVTNTPQPSEYFYYEKLYLKNPYLRDPALFQSGYAIVRCTTDPQSQKKFRENYDLDCMFLILKKDVDFVEAFFFALKNQNERDYFRFIHQIHLLNKFASYFKREAKLVIDRAMSEGYNLKDAMGPSFYKMDKTAALLSHNPQTKKFLNKISPLSLREEQCLESYRKGRSAQATAALLHLSQRTVEHYYDNIKNKLGLRSKTELLEL